MSKKFISFAKGIFAGIVICTALAFAGTQDYRDAVISEMKNNGAYYELSEQHPHATDLELIKLYEEQR